MVSLQSLEEGQDRLSTARKKITAAENDPAISKHADQHVSNPMDVLTGCQRAIEHSAKSVFILMEVQYPNEHRIPLDSEPARQLLNAVSAEFDEYFDTGKTARLIVLTGIWAGVYPASEYGVNFDRGTIEARDIFDKEDANAVYEYAKEAKRIASTHMGEASQMLY